MPGGAQCLPYCRRSRQHPPAATVVLPQKQRNLKLWTVTGLSKQSFRGMLIIPYRKGRMFCLIFFFYRRAGLPKKWVFWSPATQGRRDKNQYQILLSFQTTINKLLQLSRCLSPLERWRGRHRGHRIVMGGFLPSSHSRHCLCFCNLSLF